MRDIINPYRRQGVWFKGSVHSHTTNSDGRLAPEESIALHKTLGYDFVSISDHQKVTDTTGLSSKTFGTLPGGEFGGVLTIGIKEPVRAPDHKMGEQVAEARAQGALAIIAHPHWSGLDMERLRSMLPFDGIEIYNNGVEEGTGNGYAVEMWDLLLQAGQRVWGFAVDDAHHKPHSAPGKAWIMVQADRLDGQQLFESIRAGGFYSTQGPRLDSIELNGSTLQVRTSPVKWIKFVSYGVGRGKVLHSEDCTGISSGSVDLEARVSWKDDSLFDKYVRVELEDFQGKCAWLNPIFLQ